MKKLYFKVMEFHICRSQFLCIYYHSEKWGELTFVPLRYTFQEIACFIESDMPENEKTNWCCFYSLIFVDYL